MEFDPRSIKKNESNMHAYKLKLYFKNVLKFESFWIWNKLTSLNIALAFIILILVSHKIMWQM